MKLILFSNQIQDKIIFYIYIRLEFKYRLNDPRIIDSIYIYCFDTSYHLKKKSLNKIRVWVLFYCFIKIMQQLAIVCGNVS